MTLPAIPSALDLLRRQLHSAGDIDDLILPLRALQFRGLSKADITLHIELERAANEAGKDDDLLEERCLLAIELVEGLLPSAGLTWDAAHDAASLIARTLTPQDAQNAIDAALESSDLLPPRPNPAQSGRDLTGFTQLAIESYVDFVELPSRCDEYRAPKGAFTTRPAALLRFPDRLALEALVAPIEKRLAAELPSSVLWPRQRRREPRRRARELVLEAESPYVVKTDISLFYESVEHATLAVFLIRNLGLPTRWGRALEALLDAVMGSSRGLPQGPPVSDILASAYLLPIDRELAAAHDGYLRFADDLFFPATDLAHGRRILESVELLAADLGLSLNAEKTRVMRRSVFQEGLQQPARAVKELGERLTRSEVQTTQVLRDPGELVESLRDAGVDEETLWDLMYHGTITLDEIVAGLVDETAVSMAKSYGTYLRSVARLLAGGDTSGDLSALDVLARECLSFLAATREPAVGPEHLATLQQWFPGLAPRVVDYLTALGDKASDWRDPYLLEQIEKAHENEWVAAWMCFAAGQTGAAANPDVKALLHTVVGNGMVGQLARAEALRSLAIVDAVVEGEWRRLFAELSAPLQTEMVVAAMADVERVPWLKEAIDDLAPTSWTPRVAGEIAQPDTES
jgi:hypothetical protein